MRMLLITVGILIATTSLLIPLAQATLPDPIIFQVVSSDSIGNGVTYSCLRDTILYVPYSYNVAPPPIHDKGENQSNGFYIPTFQTDAWGEEVLTVNSNTHYVTTIGMNSEGNFCVVALAPNVFDQIRLIAYDLDDQPPQKWDVNLVEGLNGSSSRPLVDVNADGSVIICAQDIDNLNTLVRSFNSDNGNATVLYEEDDWIPCHIDVTNDGNYFLIIQSDYWNVTEGIYSQEGIGFKVIICEAADGSVVWQTGVFRFHRNDVVPGFGFTSSGTSGLGAFFSGDGNRVVIHTSDSVGIFDTITGNLIWSDDTEHYSAAAISTNGSVLILAYTWWREPLSLGLRKLVWDAANSEYDEEWTWEDDWFQSFSLISHVTMSANGKFIAVGGGYGNQYSARIGLWNIDDVNPVWIQRGLDIYLNSLSISGTGSFIAASSDDHPNINDFPKSVLIKADKGDHPVKAFGGGTRTMGRAAKISHNSKYCYWGMEYDSGGSFIVNAVKACGEIEDDDTWWGNLYVGECDILEGTNITVIGDGAPTVLHLDGDITIHGYLSIDASDRQIDVYLNGFNINVARTGGILRIGLPVDEPYNKAPQVQQGVFIHGPGGINILGGEAHFVGFIDQPVTFLSDESVPAPGDWNGIQIEDITDSSSLRYVDIQYPINGLKATDCSNYLTLDHVTVTDFQSTGIYLINSNPTISNTSASGSGTNGSHLPVGLFAYNSKPKVTNCYFDNNAKGIEVSGNSILYLGYSSVSTNDSAGITFYGGTGYLYNSSYYADLGFNHIIGNGAQGGVYKPGTSYPYLSSGSSGQGKNSIYSNYPYEIYNNTTLQIPAENNWWNDILGPSMIYGLVDYSPWLMSDPYGGPASCSPDDDRKIRVAAIYSYEDYNKNIITDALNEAFYDADDLLATGEFSHALEAYSNIVSTYPQDERTQRAFGQIHSCLLELNRSGDWRDIITDIARNERLDAKNRLAAQRLLVQTELQRNNARTARDQLNDILREIRNDNEERPYLLFDLGMLQHHGLGDLAGAINTFEEIIGSYRGHPIYSIAIRELEICNRENSLINTPPSLPMMEEDLPDQFKLLDCYPNPFNASVRIDYSIPLEGHYWLSVYDVNGRLVDLLFTGDVQEGNFSHTWTAPSAGIYFVALSNGTGVANVNKVVCLK